MNSLPCVFYFIVLITSYSVTCPHLQCLFWIWTFGFVKCYIIYSSLMGYHAVCTVCQLIMAAMCNTQLVIIVYIRFLANYKVLLTNLHCGNMNRDISLANNLKATRYTWNKCTPRSSRLQASEYAVSKFWISYTTRQLKLYCTHLNRRNVLLILNLSQCTYYCG